MKNHLNGFVPIPPEFAAKYRAQGYWSGRTLGELLRMPAADAERTAIVDASGRWTYAQLDEQADLFAAGLAGSGITRGDRVVIQMSNRVEFAVASIGCFRAGVVPVFGLPGHRDHEISHLVSQSGAVAVITESAHQGFAYVPLALRVAAAHPAVRLIVVAGLHDPAEVTASSTSQTQVRSFAAIVGEGPHGEPSKPDPDDVAFFLLSGGTTGQPKLIPRTHDDYHYQLVETAKATDMSAEGCYLAALPVAHNAALGCPGLLGTLLVGGKVIMPESPSPDEVMDTVATEHVTLITLMPPMVQLWREMRELIVVDLSNLIIQVGSAHMPPDLGRSIGDELGARLTHWFGMAEGLLTFTRLDDPVEVAIHTQGRPMSPADELLVVGPDDRPVRAGETGELLTRGPYTIRGYFAAPEVNERSFTADGFLRTGDLVRFTEAGEMVVEGRLKDVINKGGEKIIAAELEDLLSEKEGLGLVSVGAVSDPIMGETPCIFVASEAPSSVPSLAELRAFLSERGLAPFKLPDRLHIVAQFPRTAVGKIDKAALRAQFDATQS